MMGARGGQLIIDGLGAPRAAAVAVQTAGYYPTARFLKFASKKFMVLVENWTYLLLGISTDLS